MGRCTSLATVFAAVFVTAVLVAAKEGTCATGDMMCAEQDAHATPPTKKLKKEWQPGFADGSSADGGWGSSGTADASVEECTIARERFCKKGEKPIPCPGCRECRTHTPLTLSLTAMRRLCAPSVQ